MNEPLKLELKSKLINFHSIVKTKCAWAVNNKPDVSKCLQRRQRKLFIFVIAGEKMSFERVFFKIEKPF